MQGKLIHLQYWILKLWKFNERNRPWNARIIIPVNRKVFRSMPLILLPCTHITFLYLPFGIRSYKGYERGIYEIRTDWQGLQYYSFIRFESWWRKTKGNACWELAEGKVDLRQRRLLLILSRGRYAIWADEDERKNFVIIIIITTTCFLLSTALLFIHINEEEQRKRY